MTNPQYGVWDYDDIDNVGWDENGAPYIRRTRTVRDGEEIHDLSEKLED